MSRAADILEQDVGGGEGDNLPTYENLAEAHGPNSRYGYSSISRSSAFSLSHLVQVRQVEKLGRKEVNLITRFYNKTSPESIQKSRRAICRHHSG
jgi:hypothetical protein